MTAVAPRDVDVRNLQFAPGNAALHHRTTYPASISVCVRFGGRDRRRSAIDVSVEGMFVESPDHLGPGELVQVLVAMPQDRTLRALATVERVVTPDEAAFCGGMPGMGLRFFLMDARLQARWAAYLVEVAKGALPKKPDPKAIEHRQEELDPSRRAQPRKDAAFRVRIADEASLRTFHTRNVSRGGMFLATTDVKELGTRLDLVVRHPVSGRQFPLAAEVRWTRAHGPVDEQGMGVRLLGDDAAREDAFLRFINEG
jgi:uncharacterized protein (TIGR02266 family)